GERRDMKNKLVDLAGAEGGAHLGEAVHLARGAEIEGEVLRAGRDGGTSCRPVDGETAEARGKRAVAVEGHLVAAGERDRPAGDTGGDVPGVGRCRNGRRGSEHGCTAAGGDDQRIGRVEFG